MASTFTPTVLTSGGSGGSGSSTAITQTAHGFAVGDWVYLNGSVYTKAKADSANTAAVVGIVSAVADANNFTLTTSGLVTGLSGLTVGADYFLSAVTAGAMTATEPTTTGYVSAPVGIAASATSIQVAIKRSVVIGTSNVFTSITLANNATTTIQNISSFANGEGGVLTGTVVIDAGTDYTFGFEISFTKDTAGVINHSVRYFAGDIPTLALFSVGVSGQNIQMTLGSHGTFVSARARFQLSASAVSPSLQIDSANVSFTNIQAASSAGITFKEDGGTTTMKITDAGDVGIGVPSPATKLDVNGGIRIPSLSSLQMGNGSTYTYTDVTSNGSFIFGTSSTERMRIDAAGSLKIAPNSINGGTTKAFSLRSISTDGGTNSANAYGTNRYGAGKFVVLAAFDPSGNSVSASTAVGNGSTFIYLVTDAASNY